MTSAGADFGQHRSTYTAYNADGTELESIELLSDSEALKWGTKLNEEHDEPFSVVAHRKTAGQEDAVLGTWGKTVTYDIGPGYKLTERQA
jgi:hypothetical protein